MRRALLVVVLTGLLAALPAAAAQRRTENVTYHDFLVHVDSKEKAGGSCGGFVWSHTSGYCYGRSAPSGHSYSFSARSVDVSWCRADDPTCPVGSHRPIPTGYVRWMKFCERAYDSCASWLLGAVHMPNGPFHVVAGKIDGHTVHADDGNPHHLARAGGPLHLVVTYLGGVGNGNGRADSNAYSFGVIGKVAF